MLKLIKYEFRKQLFTKFIMLILVGLLQIYFFYGLFIGGEEKLSIAAVLFMLLSIGSILFVSFECILTYSNDLKTKCSYMLFMTPHSSYCIIGAKTLSAIFQIVLTSAAFVALGLVDFTMVVAKYDDLSKLLEYLSEMFQINVTVSDFVLMMATIVVSWICIVLFAFLAITLSTTFLADKRGKGIVSFLIFIVVCSVKTKVANMVLDWSAFNYTTRDFVLNIVITTLFAALSYVITSYMLEEKVSL